jgi:Tfp pilus assembly protein PilF
MDTIQAARQQNRKQLLRADELGKKGDDAGAEKIWRKYLRKCPHDPVILFNMGANLRKKADTPELRHEAGEFFARVIESQYAEPELKADCMNNLGLLALKAGSPEKAMTSFAFALKISPEHPAALANYGDQLRCAGDFTAAQDCYTKLALADPDSAEAHYSSGFIALLMGDLERGWKEYQWRTKLQSWQTKPLETTRPFWTGENLEGKTLMLTEEQGFGDSFMFIRYARPLSKLGARVVWGGQERIREVMRGVRGLAGVVPRDDSTEFDYHLPLLDAPLMLGTRLDTIPGAHCLTIRDEWPKWTPPEGSRKKRVALVWAGSPLHGRDHARSIPAESFQPIVDAHPECEFYALQVGPGWHQIGNLRNVTDLGPTLLNGWTDTAQALSWVDLLISVDTSVVHLAGALDKEVWMLTPSSPDWRWRLGKEDSEWYPHLRLFRQPHKDDWETPLGENQRRALNYPIG